MLVHKFITLLEMKKSVNTKSLIYVGSIARNGLWGFTKAGGTIGLWGNGPSNVNIYIYIYIIIYISANFNNFFSIKLHF